MTGSGTSYLILIDELKFSIRFLIKEIRYSM